MEHIAVSDIESLVSFFETSQDMACIEDILHMIIRALSQKSLLASFLDQVNLVGGCHLFVNLLQRYMSCGYINKLTHFVICGDILRTRGSEHATIHFHPEMHGEIFISQGYTK